jgi:hypothetical protein
MLNATHVTFGSKLINVDWAVPVLRMQDVQARMLVNYVFIFRDTGPKGIARFSKNWVDAYTGKTGRTNMGLCYWGEAWQDRPEEQKEYLEMKKQYQDISYSKYYKEFAKGDDEFKERSAQQTLDFQNALTAVTANPMAYLNRSGKGIDPESVRREFGLTNRDAGEIARLVNRSIQKKDTHT